MVIQEIQDSTLATNKGPLLVENYTDCSMLNV